VVTGDAIILRGGTYRTGNLVLNQGIIIQPYADEQPVLKGTYIPETWTNLKNGLWTAKWSRLFPSGPQDWWYRSRFGKNMPMHRFNNDMVFADGRFLQSVGWEGDVDENTYYINYEDSLVYVGVDPSTHMIEVTAFDVGLHRVTGKANGKITDHKGPVIRGITFTQYAFRALEIEGTFPEGLSPEAEHGKEVMGTVLEHCTISFCSRIAAKLRGDSLILRNCKISDTSTEGIYLESSSDCLLEKNIFTHNNIEHYVGYYPAAVKIFNQCYRVTCNDNLVIDLPYSNGIWYDVGNVDGVFTNNWVEGVGNPAREFNPKRPYPSENGFFFEISKGVVCAGNVFVNCDQGIFILNSSNARIYQNTFVNSTACIGRNERSAVNDHFGWHPSTGPDVDKRVGHVFVNNLLTGDANYHRPLLFVWQPDVMCSQLNKPMLKQLDNNVYVNMPGKTPGPLVVFSPVPGGDCQGLFETPASLHKVYADFSTGARYYLYDDIALFKSPYLGNYQVLKGFPGTEAAAELPEGIIKLLGLPADYKPYVGAYPPMQ